MADVYESISRNSSQNPDTDYLDQCYQDSIRSDAAFIDNASSFIKSTNDLNDSTNLSLFSKSSENSPIQNPADSNQYNALAGLSVSRPLSRSSMTSELSVTATKDGIEGKRVKKQGIPGYPLNLINKMYANYSSKKPSQPLQQSPGITHNGSHNPLHLNPETSGDDANAEITSVTHLSAEQADDTASILSLSSMIPQYSRENITGFTHGPSQCHIGISHESPDFNYTLGSSQHMKRRDDTMELDDSDDDYIKFLRRSVSEKSETDNL